MLKGGSTAVIGEVYEVSHATLAELDYLEGHPSFYRREQLAFESFGELWVYLLPRGGVEGYRRIVSGDWVEEQLLVLGREGEEER